jgi:hypothetical protein
MRHFGTDPMLSPTLKAAESGESLAARRFTMDNIVVVAEEQCPAEAESQSE